MTKPFGKERVRISKFLSLILRHEAAKFGVTLDEHGFADVDSVLSVLQKSFPDFTQDDLPDLAAQDEKGRFEIIDDKIRARYGHSLYVKPTVEPTEPPEILYHGTSRKAAQWILEQGLRSMSRRFVHLSATVEEARKVGRRHSRDVVIFEIKARAARDAGIDFFAEHNTYLAEHIPADFLETIKDQK
jgi:putative RNA 2'-phosphotransferase